MKTETDARRPSGRPVPAPTPTGQAGQARRDSAGAGVGRMTSPETSHGGRGRVGFILAAAAYGIWLGFLAVLAVIQKVR
jgi:hypothetical protein